MTPVSKSLVAGALALAVLAAAAGSAQAMQNGGRISTRIAIPGVVTFDPPGAFTATLPLTGFYLNAKTGMSFVGTGAVLDVASSNFGVTGFSGGFLAFNCHSRNEDGSVPKLPLRIKFSRPVALVSMDVGSLASAGAPVTLTASDAKGHQFARQSVIAAPAVQTIEVAVGTPKIASVTLTGPCNLAVDDIFGSNAESMVLGHR